MGTVGARRTADRVLDSSAALGFRDKPLRRGDWKRGCLRRKSRDRTPFERCAGSADSGRSVGKAPCGHRPVRAVRGRRHVCRVADPGCSRSVVSPRSIALCRSNGARPGRYRIIVVFSIGPTGAVEKVRRIGSSGDAGVDRQFDATLGSVRFSETPPEDFAQPVRILIVPDAPGVTPGCAGADVRLRASRGTR